MKNKRNVVFSSIIIAIYVLTISFYAISLITEFVKGPSRTEKRFNSIARNLSINARQNELNSTAFNENLISSINNFSDIEKIQIKADGQLIFSYPNKISSEKKSSLIKEYSTTFTTASGTDIFLAASFYLLRPRSIFYKGVTAFIIILVSIFLTVIYLIFFADDKNTKIINSDLKNSDKSENLKTPDDILSDSELNFSDKTNSENKISESTDNIPESIPEETNSEDIQNDESNTTNSPEPQLAFTPEEMAVLSQITSDLTKEAEAELSNDRTNDSQTTSGLFCPETKFSWESNLISRLDTELIEAASSETNLALITIKIPEIEWTTDYGSQISKKILDTAKFNDLVFNYKEDGCTIILKETGSEKAIQITQKLLLAIKTILKDFCVTDKAAAGISTRDDRLISGNRLFNESEQALIHAEADQASPLVAYKVDPEKYRDYLANEISKM